MLKRLRQRGSARTGTTGILAECARIQRHRELEAHRLLRIDFDDAPPAVAKLVNPVDGSQLDLSRTPQHESARQLHDALELLPNFALRMGTLDVHGYAMNARHIARCLEHGGSIRASDLRPAIGQKGVDLRIGLDIARLALRRLVDTVVIVTGDSDMVPAFKFARREGLRVCLDHLGAPVKRELKAHVDVVLN